MHDVIVLDAFSSDSIPIHLLTREAVELYLSRLNADGILAIHISNNHLDLRPVVAGVMRDLGLTGRVEFQHEPGRTSTSGRYGSHWAVLARSEAVARPAGTRLALGCVSNRATTARGRTISPTSGASSSGADHSNIRVSGLMSPLHS